MNQTMKEGRIVPLPFIPKETKTFKGLRVDSLDSNISLPSQSLNISRSLTSRVYKLLHKTFHKLIRRLFSVEEQLGACLPA